MNELTEDHSIIKRETRIVPYVLIVCIIIVVVWEFMANRSKNPFRPFDLTAESLVGFKPSAEGWVFYPVTVNSSPIEPNIIALRVEKVGDSRVPVYVRLVHGYNMRDCMRLKGYKVELVEDRSSSSSAKASEDKEDGRQKTDVRSQMSEVRDPTTDKRQQTTACRSQIWRLTSRAGDVSIWVTSMLKAGDFSVVDMDVRSMPFPRVSVPDDPGWVPRGVTLASLRHPIDNFNSFLRSKWNNARCDLATFLRLKTPSWASNEILTVVSCSQGPSVKNDQEGVVLQAVLSAHYLVLSRLQSWRTATNKKTD